MNQNEKAEEQESRADQDLEKVTAFLRELTSLNPAMQINTAMLLLQAAMNQDKEGGYHTADIKNDLGLKGPFVTHSSYYWSELGMLELSIGTDDRRKRRLTVTAAGKKFVKKLARHLA